MKKAIITGASGFVGGALLAELVKNGVEVIALDIIKSERIIEHENVTFLQFDLNEIKDLPQRIKAADIDVFYHLAWRGSAGDARFDTKLQLENAQLTVEAVRIAKEMGCKKVVCAGTIMELETISAAFKQGNQPGLGYIYGSGKLVAHTMAKSVAAHIGIDLVWAEITNAYGEGELSPRFINTTLRKMIHNKPLQFTAATQNYDFIHVCDVARAFYLLGEKGKGFCEYLIGSASARPLKEFITEMRDVLAPDKELVFGDIPFTGVNLALSDFSTEKIEQDTGFRAAISFADGITRTMDWLREQEGQK